MIIELLSDPTMWFGLLALVLLEIILGIDNLIFIAILSDKLAPHQRDRARIIGLSLAMIMRIGLLFCISWIISVKEPWIGILGRNFSGRDLILIGGGVLLLFKATMELHERLEIKYSKQNSTTKTHATFWSTIIQIIVLDAVFSLDSIITAVGMVEELSIMIIAVIISVLIMIVASKPLTIFINRNPVLIILCLGFLLMIGFILVAEGFGVHIPKGYLYSAIGFSLLVEVFNQLSRAKRNGLLINKKSLRERTSEAVLRLLGEKTSNNSEDLEVIASSDVQLNTFNDEERGMIKGVLSLAEISAKSIMKPYEDLDLIYINDSVEVIYNKMLKSPFSRLVVVQNKSNLAVGFVQKKDILNLLIGGNELSILSVMQQPLTIKENKSPLYILSAFKKTGFQIAFVEDNKGNFIGIITLTDVIEAITGDVDLSDL